VIRTSEDRKGSECNCDNKRGTIIRCTHYLIHSKEASSALYLKNAVLPSGGAMHEMFVSNCWEGKLLIRKSFSSGLPSGL
jgi:hypothetical protein